MSAGADSDPSTDDIRTARGTSLKRSGSLRCPAFAFLVALAALVIDQVTKVLAVRHLTGEAPRDLIGSLLRLNLTYNPGAAFGLGAGFTVAIAILAVLAVLVISAFVVKVRSVVWALALGLVLAGVAGNLCDRLLRDPGPLRGHVVDFLQLPHWPIFNVADMCINIGALLIVVQFARGVELGGARHDDPAR